LVIHAYKVDHASEVADGRDDFTATSPHRISVAATDTMSRDYPVMPT